MIAELELFWWSIVYGVLIFFFYDLIRSIRAVWKCGKILVTIEDFLFWIAVGIFLFTRIYLGNGGILRGYFFLGVLAGMLAYYGTISRYVVKFVSFLLKRLKMLFLWVKIFLGKLLSATAITGIVKNGEKNQKEKKRGKAKRRSQTE